MNNQIKALLNKIETELKAIRKEKDTAWTTSEYNAINSAYSVMLDMIEEIFNIDMEQYRNIL